MRKEFPFMPRRPIFRLFLVLFTLSVLAGCAASPANLAEEAKRDRIKEMYADFQSEFPGVQTVTPEDVVEMQQRDDVIVVDVREPKEQAVSMIPGAMTKAEFESRQEELKGKKVIAYCTIGYRSGIYTKRLQEEGWDAYNLPGSILSWVLAGHPVVDEAGNETKKVHVYGKQWDLLPDGYEGMY
jgi:rhodanese-related sulfurtransferase